jgi:hypothetical protein
MLSRQRKGKKIAVKVGRVCNISSQGAISYYFPYLRFIFQNNPRIAADLALEFQLFDIEPGKRKTKIIWNGEIDFFVKSKDENRAIKKRIREIYPQIERIKGEIIESETLERIKLEQRSSRKKSENQLPKKQDISTKKKKGKVKTDKKSESRIKKPKKVKESPKIKEQTRKKKESSKKSLTDFFT